MERIGGFYWVKAHQFPVVAEYCGGYWLFPGGEDALADNGQVEVLSERLIPPSVEPAGAAPDRSPCPMRDSNGVPCEKLSGHTGLCGCPEALARFHARRATKHIRIP